MPAATELIAHGRTQDEICAYIGADHLVYQELSDLIEAVQKKSKSDVSRFDTSVFSGEYVTGGVDGEYLSRLEASRNDLAKQERDAAICAAPIDLYNQS
jgi:amidophosphoribosyltransferase